MPQTPLLTNREIIARQATYRAGTRAVYDAMFSGLVPIRVTEVIKSAFGYEVSPCGRVRAVVLADHGGFHKGQAIEIPTHSAVPLQQLRKTEFHIRVNCDYWCN